MAPGLLDSIKSWFNPDGDDDYEVAEYVLSRREPDPENRIRSYESVVTPEEVLEDADGLPGGVYLLQEVKPHGMAGKVVWEEALGDTDLIP